MNLNGSQLTFHCRCCS